MQPVPPSLADAVTREVRGERILWASSPNRWLYARKYLPNTLIGIPFLGFSLFWEYQVSSHIPMKDPAGPGVFFPLWGLMFVGIGLVMFFSPLLAAWQSGHVYYIVTERRALIVQKVPWLRIQSFPPSAVAGFDRVSGGGTGGSIIFQRIISRGGRGTRTKEIGFIGVPDFAGAEAALAKLVQGGGN